jgi:hypothetical protein
MAGKALMTAMSTSNMEAKDPGDGIRKFIKNEKRKKMLLDKGEGKYAAPVRYAIRQTKKNIKDKFEDVTKGVKDAISMRRAKEDASGPTSRNRSVGVCTAGGKCQN